MNFMQNKNTDYTIALVLFIVNFHVLLVSSLNYVYLVDIIFLMGLGLPEEAFIITTQLCIESEGY